jgi:hypothetical protein
MQTELKFLTALVLSTLVPALVVAQDMPPAALAAYVPAELPVDSAAAPPAATPAAPAKATFSQQELEQIIAPVALYPDALLSQILMASTYPLEVVQAARWSRDNPGLAGDAAVKAVEQQEWDPSVKSLVAFPQVLGMLDQNIDWMERLGNAVLAQQAQVTLTVQNLRQRAQANGDLASNDRMRVEQQGGDIMLEPADPRAVSVPYYNPAVVFAPWLSSQYPPAYFSQPQGYYYAAPATGFYWGPAIVISAGFFFGGFDWHRHCVSVVNVHPFYYRPGFGGRMGVYAGAGAWQHDAMHRHGVAYGSENLRQQYARPVGNQMAGFGAAQAQWRGPSQAMLMRPGVAASPYSHPPGFAPGAAVEQRSFERAAERSRQETPRQETPVLRERAPAANINNFSQAMRMAQGRSLAPPQYAFHSAAYAPAYSYPRAAPRPVSMASASYAHYAAPAHYGGGGGGGGHGGGGHVGGGHGGGGHGGRR